MKCLILVAGYAKRLYPLTKNKAKSLLLVKGKTVLDWLMDDLRDCGNIDEFVLVSNNRFYDDFVAWAKGRRERIMVLNDGTYDDEGRLGAVRDIQFAVTQSHLDQDSLLVLAGDNLLDFSLKSFLRYAQAKNSSCVMRYDEPNQVKLTHTGVLKVDEKDRIVAMWEKPEKPQANWCCPPFYYFIKRDVARVREGLAEGCGVDSPGSYIAWLCSKTIVHAMLMPGRRFDIGTVDSYRLVQEEYSGILKQ